MAKTKTIENLFNYLAFFSDLLPCLLFFIFLKKTKSIQPLWIIVLYCVYDFLTNIGLLYLDHKPARVFLYSSFTFFEYAFFVWILFLFIKNAVFRKFIIGISFFFALFIIIYNLLVKVIGIDSIPIGVEAILILIFSFYYLYEQMKGTDTLFVYSRYPFWIVLGMMLYLAGSFFIYIYASQLDPSEVGKYWIYTNIFSIIKNIFFTIAILLYASHKAKSEKINYKVYSLN